MDRLSSCYFCGAALDAQLSEYPVVPRRLQSEGAEEKTVVLCDGCRRKLGNILEPVVDAVESESPAAPDYEDSDFEPIDASANGDSAPDRPVSAETDGDAGETDPDIETVSTTDTAVQSTDAAGSGADHTSGETETDTGTTQPADDGAQEDSDGPSLTKLEYNKVMRLLQNREFPVDRAEIREVATSAYQIDPEEFDAVIDAAIERGLIAEENGQFVEAEGR